MKRIYKLFFIFLQGLQRHINIAGVNGFMLIELIVATLIASLLGGLLLTALYQSGRVQTSVDNTINISERVGIVVSVLEKDLAGAFVPAAAEAMAGKPSDKAAEDKTDEAQKKTNESAQKTPEKADAATSEAKKQKPLEKIFYSTNKDGMLDTLTFVTNNPLVVFVGKDVGVVKPKVVRVQYTLKPDKENKGSYVLFRQESNELDLAGYKNVRPYEVIGGIKKVTVSYTARIEKKQEQKAGEQTTKEKSKKSYEYKVQSEWVSEQKKETSKEADKKGEEFPRIPYSVEFKMTLWDKQNKKEQEFIFVCEIPVDSIEAQRQAKQEQRSFIKEESKPEAKEQSKQQGQQQKVAHMMTNSQEVVVYNGIETLANTLDSLKRLLGHV